MDFGLKESGLLNRLEESVSIAAILGNQDSFHSFHFSFQLIQSRR